MTGICVGSQGKVREFFHANPVATLSSSQLSFINDYIMMKIKMTDGEIQIFEKKKCVTIFLALM